jgi:Spy/CpxP family protein refolding chaperone
MESSKFLKIVIVILLIINIATLGFIYLQRPPHGFPPPPIDAGQYIAHELNFTGEQEEQFNILREENKSVIEELRKASKDFHDHFFDLLKTHPSDSLLVLQMADSIVLNQKQIELATFSHFQKVRALCTPEQQKKFDEIIKDALRMMAPHGRRPGMPPGHTPGR